jgi:hypothetical protein
VFGNGLAQDEGNAKNAKVENQKNVKISDLTTELNA